MSDDVINKFKELVGTVIFPTLSDENKKLITTISLLLNTQREEIKRLQVDLEYQDKQFKKYMTEALIINKNSPKNQLKG